MISLGSVALGLRRATLLFLTLPLMIFFAGWLRWPLALVVDGLLAAAIWRGLTEVNRAVFSPLTEQDKISWCWLLVGIVVPSAVLTLLSGAGGWGAGDSDWLKHDTILRDLLERPWPVTYETGQGPVLLVYYVTFYLPAALLGKLAGGSWIVASQALALTTFAGIVLAAGWMVVLAAVTTREYLNPSRVSSRWTLTRRSAVIVIVIFFGFSGLDVLGKMAVNHYLGLPVFYGDWSDIEWWAQFAQYSSSAATVFWAPQHAFGGWLTAALVLDDWFQRRAPERRAALYLALALAWSPFAAVGLLPLVGGIIFWKHWPGTTVTRAGFRMYWQGLPRRLRQSFLTMENGAGVLAGGMFTLFLAAHFQSYPIPAEYKVMPGFHPMPVLSEMPFGGLYLLFACVEFVGFGLATWLYFRPVKYRLPANLLQLPDDAKLLHVWQTGQAGERHRLERRILWPVLLVLLALPWFRYGYANDLVMRGGIPALFMLQALVARMFAQTDKPLIRRQRVAVWLAAVLLVGGLGNTFLEYRRHVVKMVAQGSWRDARTRESVRTLAELHRTIYARPGFDFTRQYLGSVDSPFVRYAAAQRGALRPGASERGKPDF